MNTIGNHSTRGICMFGLYHSCTPGRRLSRNPAGVLHEGRGCTEQQCKRDEQAGFLECVGEYFHCSRLLLKLSPDTQESEESLRRGVSFS